MEGDLANIVSVFADAGVETILIGGLAGQAHGASRLTQDVDFIYSRRAANIERLATALAPHHPYLRGAPPGLPFRFDRATIERGLNFTLTTSLGDVDLLGEMLGGGNYEQVIPHTVMLSVFGRALRVLDLPALIRAKRAAGRPRTSKPSLSSRLCWPNESARSPSAGLLNAWRARRESPGGLDDREDPRGFSRDPRPQEKINPRSRLLARRGSPPRRFRELRLPRRPTHQAAPITCFKPKTHRAIHPATPPTPSRDPLAAPHPRKLLNLPAPR